MSRAPALLLIALCGCHPPSSGRPTVSGTVTLKGQPLANRTLILFSTTEEGSAISQMIPINHEGKFSGEVPGPGSYKIVVQESMAVLERREPRPEGANAIPERYRQVATTDLTWDIQTGSNQKTIELTD